MEEYDFFHYEKKIKIKKCIKCYSVVVLIFFLFSVSTSKEANVLTGAKYEN